MYKIFIILCLTSMLFTVSAQTSSNQQREKIRVQVNRELQYAEIMDYLRKRNEQIGKSLETQKPLLAIQYKSFANKVKRWCNNRWLIADTGLSRKWLKQVHELLAYLGEMQAFIEAAKINGNTKSPKYEQALKYFDAAHHNFSNLIKKPVRVSGKIRRRAQQQKLLWQKAMRKKYQL